MEDDALRFDEDDAIKFIREYIPLSVSEKYDDDEILYVIDVIWDWYEKNGYLTIDSGVTDEEELDVSKLTDYVRKEISKDKEMLMDSADIDHIVKGELKYEESIEDVF